MALSFKNKLNIAFGILKMKLDGQKLRSAYHYFIHFFFFFPYLFHSLFLLQMDLDFYFFFNLEFFDFWPYFVF